MPDTRRRGIRYLHKRLGYIPSLISTSKFFRAEESWTRNVTWWFNLPIKKVRKKKKDYYYLVGIKRKSGFATLKVPNKFLIENLKKFETRYENKIILHIKAEGKNQFVDERGKGRVDFSKFKL